MLNFFLQFDIQITQFINELIPHNHFFDLVFSFSSMIGSAASVWIAIVLFLVIFEEKRNHTFIISFIISILVTTVFVNVVIKNFVQRPRPISTNFNQLQPVSTNSCPKDFSFPSGHASVTFASAAVISFYDKKRKWGYYLVAILICLSRIYLGCHYFFDVVGGGLIGYLISRLVLIYKKTFDF